MGGGSYGERRTVMPLKKKKKEDFQRPLECVVLKPNAVQRLVVELENHVPTELIGPLHEAENDAYDEDELKHLENFLERCEEISEKHRRRADFIWITIATKIWNSVDTRKYPELTVKFNKKYGLPEDFGLVTAKETDLEALELSAQNQLIDELEWIDTIEWFSLVWKITIYLSSNDNVQLTSEFLKKCEELSLSNKKKPDFLWLQIGRKLYEGEITDKTGKIIISFNEKYGLARNFGITDDADRRGTLLKNKLFILRLYMESFYNLMANMSSAEVVANLSQLMITCFACAFAVTQSSWIIQAFVFTVITAAIVSRLFFRKISPNSSNQPNDLNDFVESDGVRIGSSKTLSTYNVSSVPKHGRVLFIHNKKFQNPDMDRLTEGTKVDELVLRETFEQHLNYDFFQSDNLEADQINKTVEDFVSLSKKDSCDAAGIIIASHGGTYEKEDVICGTDFGVSGKERKGFANVSDILSHLHCAPSLDGKPKFCIMQACRDEFNDGSSSEPQDHTQHPEPASSSAIQSDDTSDLGTKIVKNAVMKIVGRITPSVKDCESDDSTAPFGSDTIVASSSYYGFESYRTEKLGSYFIIDLCHQLVNRRKKDDIHSILTAVSNKVAGRKIILGSPPLEGNSTQQFVRQQPTFVSTLRKKFYLSGRD